MSDIVVLLREGAFAPDMVKVSRMLTAANEIELLRVALEDAANGFEVNGLYTRANKIYKVLDKE